MLDGQPPARADAAALDRIGLSRGIGLGCHVAMEGGQVMARYIDDISFSTIRELILLNNVEIIGHIQSDTAFLQRLFEVSGLSRPLAAARSTLTQTRARRALYACKPL